MILIGIDLGTTGCKSMVFSADGSILAEYYIEYEVHFFAGGAAEQDADDWWNHTAEAVQQAVAQSGVEPGETFALSVSSQGSAFVPVGCDGVPLCRAVSWYDTRGLKQAREMYAEFGEETLFYRLGHPEESLVFPEILRMREETPALHQNTWKFLMAHDYLIFRLTGKAVTDYSMAAGTMCYDVANRCWAEDLLRRYGIDPEKLPEIRNAGEPVGTILPQAAKRLGLPQGTLVSVGMQDQKIAALGAGIRPGGITVSLGTASAIESVSAQPVKDPAKAVQCHGFSASHWALESSVDTAGSALKWLKRTICPELSYAEMDRLADGAGTGANGVSFYPLLYRGTGDVNQGRFSGIGLETTRGDLIRSVLEGVACGIRERIEAQKAVSAALRNTDTLPLFGGGASSPLWCQIIADLTGMTVQIPRTKETGNLGAAICAGVGAGVFTDIWDGQKIIGEPSAVYTPEKEKRAENEALYRRYLHLKEAL